MELTFLFVISFYPNPMILRVAVIRWVLCGIISWRFYQTVYLIRVVNYSCKVFGTE